MTKHIETARRRKQVRSSSVDKTYIQEAVKHGFDVIEAQPGIDFDSVMLHVESNYPDLSDEEEYQVREAIAERFPDVCTGMFALTYTGSGHHMFPLGNFERQAA